VSASNDLIRSVNCAKTLRICGWPSKSFGSVNNMSWVHCKNTDQGLTCFGLFYTSTTYILLKPQINDSTAKALALLLWSRVNCWGSCGDGEHLECRTSMISHSVGDLAAFFFKHLLHGEMSRQGNSVEHPKHRVIMDEIGTRRLWQTQEKAKFYKLDEVPMYTKYSADSKALGPQLVLLRREDALMEVELGAAGS
jgi:hypothetical protein